MAKRRTRKEKQLATLKRKKALSEVPASEETERSAVTPDAKPGQPYSLPAVSKTKKSENDAEKSLLRVDPRYLKQDLTRSLFITIVLLLSLIGIYFYLRYN